MKGRLKLYVITCRADGRKYVGLTQQPIARRFRQHWSQRRSDSNPLYRAFREHGPKGFSTKWVASATNRKDGEQLERQMVSQLGCRFPHGFNMNEGGSGPGFGRDAEWWATYKAWRATEDRSTPDGYQVWRTA